LGQVWTESARWFYCYTACCPDAMDGAEPPRQRQQADRRTYCAAGAASLALAVGRSTALGAAAVVHCDLLLMGCGA